MAVDELGTIPKNREIGARGLSSIVKLIASEDGNWKLTLEVDLTPDEFLKFCRTFLNGDQSMLVKMERGI